MGKKSKKKQEAKGKTAIIESSPTKDKKERIISDKQSFSFSRCDLILCISGFVFTFVFYLLTLAPTVFFGDSGEFVTASYHLGITHPPGYPLYTLLGKLFMLVLPFGDMAFRMNIMSAFFASAAAAVCFLIMRVLGAGRFVSFVTIIPLAFSRTLWSQAVIAEVYTMDAFFFCLMLLLFFLWLRNLNDKLLLGLAFVCGLAITHHITIAAFYPVFLAGVAIKKRSVFRNFRFLSKIVLFFLVPLLLYAYLPIRSAANPPTDWGNPETFQSVINHITAKQYSGKLLEYGFQGVMIQIRTFIGLIFNQFAPFLFVLAVPGIILLLRKSKRFFYYILAFFIINLAYSFSYYIIDIDSYFIPVFILTALFIGMGFQAIIEPVLKSPARVMKFITYIVITVLSILPLIYNWKSCDHSRNYLARNYGENILRTIDKGGIFLSHGDNESFITAYLTLVEGQRKDVTVYDRTQNLLPYPLVKKNKNASKAAINQFERRLVFNSKRPVYFNFIPNSAYPLVEDGILYRVVRADSGVRKNPEPWEKYNLKGLDDKSLYDDLMTRFVIGKYYEAYARFLWKQGKRNEADKYLEKALSVAGDQATMFVAIGFFNIDKMRYDLAEKELKRGLELNPFSSDCYNGLGTVVYNRGEYDKALELYKKSYDLDKNNVSALINIGLAYEKLGDKEKDKEIKEEFYRQAAENFKNVREIDPYNQEMARNLDRISEKFAPVREIIEKYEKQTVSDPENAVTRYNYGVYLARQNMFEAAIEQFKMAIEADRRYISAIVDLGGAYLKIRREDLAYEQFKRALEIDPENIKAKAGIELIRSAVKSGKLQMKIKGLQEK
jgi:tetratricopeptide (TPR) repeat protein